MYTNNLLRYRPVWLGVALIWIIIFHCPLELGPFRFIKAIGYGGVDICIFASGIGCFYSLSSEPNVINFMKRRIKRLVPTYITFIVFWLTYKYIIGEFDFQMAIGNILAIQNLTGHEQEFNWYISAIFILYILAPYFKMIAEHASTTRKIIFLTFLLVISFPFWNSNTYIITITRLPIFYIGMLFANMSKNNKQINKKETICLIVSFALGIGSLVSFFCFARQHLWSYGLYWYPFILITPPLCVAISYVSMIIERIKLTKPIITFLALCGSYSFELYLVHILLFSIIPIFISKYNLLNISHLIWAIGIIGLSVGCFALRKLTTLLTHLCSKMQHT